MNRFHQIKSYFSHWLNVVDQHSIHSPFFFDFYKKVIRPANQKNGIAELEELREKLLVNESELLVEDKGARSSEGSPKRQLKDIASKSLSPLNLSQLYQRIIDYTESTYTVELGTSLGINTLYMASDPSVKVFTFEGSPSIANVALTHFEYFDKKNIQMIEGNIDTTLPEFLQRTEKISFVLIDANHRYEPTMRYFNLLIRRLNEKSIVVIDDIHWSEEMEKAWKELLKHQIVYGSIDLYRCGILFFDPALNRQHFILSL